MTVAGIYIHIPFCRSRCSYCDFATGLYQNELSQKYINAVIREIEAWVGNPDRPQVDTVYFGGGTPSLLSPSQVERILSAVHSSFRIIPGAEVTMEMNPGTVTPVTLQAFLDLGINRASFGAQTFDDDELTRLGRSHTVADTLHTFADLRAAGFNNISFDLIAGLPRQTIDGWLRNVEESLALTPEHLSFYLLEIHQGTPLAHQIERGTQPRPDDDLAASMYELMLASAQEAGYRHYEISNLCRPGFESIHNTKYWTGAPYIGFGCSAHSYDGSARRWANERDVARYVELVETGQSPIVQVSQLSDEDRRAEHFFLGLRMMDGISLQEYRAKFGLDMQENHRDEIEKFRQAGLLELNGDLLKLTRAGALLSNEVFAAFV
jgi:oxygen-independent coproporphyrinogen-3 oxidase